MIQASQLSKSFRRTTALSDINLAIDTNDRVAFIGSNGAGKTTLMRCLLGEYYYTGTVKLNDLEVRNNRTSILQRVGFVPQLPPPLKMPVGQLIQFASGICTTEISNIHAVADRLGLTIAKLKHQPFNKLSGGQKQKLLISIALGRDLDLLILDEPAANLDPKARHIFFNLLAERQNNLSMLISSHRLNEVAPLVNRVVELDKGKIVLDDHVADAHELGMTADCTLILTRDDQAFSNTIIGWSFTKDASGVVWRGKVAAADRLRFLGMLSRYAPILKSIHLDNQDVNS